MNDTRFTPNAKMEPYWWEAAPRPVLPEPKLPGAPTWSWLAAVTRVSRLR